jgi:hypothetical protein
MMVIINFLGWALVGMTLAVLIVGLAVLLRLMLATVFK